MIIKEVFKNKPDEDPNFGSDQLKHFYDASQLIIDTMINFMNTYMSMSYECGIHFITKILQIVRHRIIFWCVHKYISRESNKYIWIN